MFFTPLIAVLLGLPLLATSTPFTLPIFANSSASTDLVTSSALEIHNRVLASLPVSQITTSEHLNEYILAHGAELRASNTAVYVSDIQSWVSLGDVSDHGQGNATSAELESRESCTTLYVRAVVYSHAFWAPWHAVSSCIKTGAAPAGGSVSVQYTDTVSIAFNAGFSPSTLQGAMSASIGFDVAFEYSDSAAYTCNAQGNDGAQVWARHRTSWSRVSYKECNTCTKCGTIKYGWATATAVRSRVDLHQYGCSTLKGGARLKGC